MSHSHVGAATSLSSVQSTDGNHHHEMSHRSPDCPPDKSCRRQRRADDSRFISRASHSGTSSVHQHSLSTPKRLSTRYKRPTVEDAPNSSYDGTVDGYEANSSDGDMSPSSLALVKERGTRNRHNSGLASPLVDSPGQASPPRPVPAFPDCTSQAQPETKARDGGMGSSASSRRTSFNERVDVRTFSGHDSGHQHHDESLKQGRKASRLQPQTATANYQDSPPYSDCAVQLPESGNSASYREDPQHHALPPRTTASDFDLDRTRHSPERLRRQMYEGGVSDLAQQYLGKSTASSIRPAYSASNDLPTGAYADPVQECLDPVAFRRRQEQKAQQQHQPGLRLQSNQNHYQASIHGLRGQQGNSSSRPDLYEKSRTRSQAPRPAGNSTDMHLDREFTRSGSYQGHDGGEQSKPHQSRTDSSLQDAFKAYSQKTPRFDAASVCDTETGFPGGFSSPQGRSVYDSSYGQQSTAFDDHDQENTSAARCFPAAAASAASVTSRVSRREAAMPDIGFVEELLDGEEEADSGKENKYGSPVSTMAHAGRDDQTRGEASKWPTSRVGPLRM